MPTITTKSIAGHDIVQSWGETSSVIVRSRGAAGSFDAGPIGPERQPALARIRGVGEEVAVTASEVVAYGTAIVTRARA